VNRWSPHANTERPEPISYRPEIGQRPDRGDRDEFVERLVASIVPGVERHSLKKLAVDESALLKNSQPLARGSEENGTRNSDNRG
jgi:hypothetical protein